MPHFPIVDAHVHLYDVERLKYGWLASVPRINRTHTLTEFDAEREDVAIERFVFAEVDVDPGLHIREAEFVQAMADRDPRLAGIVAHAPLQIGPRVEDDLVALKALRNVRGIRRLIQSEPDPAFCLEPAFLEALRLLPKYDLTFEICVKHTALVYAIELARRCPEVSFVLDHIGKPDIKNGLVEPWRGQMIELAKCPNVVVKVSGVITEADHAHWSADQVKPYVAEAFEAFGFSRTMFGSDWTVSKLTHAYPAWVAILDEVMSGVSEAEARQFYRETAIRIYRLG